MAINKVIDRNNNTLIDLTMDTVTPEKVLYGEVFHTATGETKIGTLNIDEKTSDRLDVTKYNFIDYDGTLLYSYTDAELDALNELPAGPNHSSDNLSFQEWNWSLEDLKSWNRERPDRPIVGATLITSDEKSYIYLNNKTSIDVTLPLYVKNGNIDWGDGTTDSTTDGKTFSHIFPHGNYIISIEHTSTTDAFFYWQNNSNNTARRFIEGLKVGRITYIQNTFPSRSNISKFNIPNTITKNTYYPEESIYEIPNLKAIVFPKWCTHTPTYGMFNYTAIDTISVGKTFSNLYLNSLVYLKNLVLPDGCSTSDISYTKLSSIYIPSNSSKKVPNFSYNTNLKNIIIDDSIETFTPSFSNNNPDVTFNFPKNLKKFSFSVLSALKNRIIEIPESVTTLFGGAQTAYNLNVIIPDTISSLPSGLFNTSYTSYYITLDLSKQTKVIPLTGSIGSFTIANGSVILVPSALLDQYKSASYWSNYADCIVGV